MIVDCAVYEEGVRRPGEVGLVDAYHACRSDRTFAWIGLHEPTEDEFSSVRREFLLHELAVEDAITAHQRPKLEVYDETLFLVLKTARYVEADETVEFGEIQLFVGADFIITVRHGGRRSSTTSGCGWSDAPICFAAARARRCTQSSIGSSTTTRPSSPASTTTFAR